jgi:hypothetical protein
MQVSARRERTKTGDGWWVESDCMASGRDASRGRLETG